jgi:hypothetical protein
MSARAIQSVDRRLRAALVGFHAPGLKPLESTQLARRAQPFESIERFPPAFLLAHHHGRDLSVTFERMHHAALGFWNVETGARIRFADLV